MTKVNDTLSALLLLILGVAVITMASFMPVPSHDAEADEGVGGWGIEFDDGGIDEYFSYHATSCPPKDILYPEVKYKVGVDDAHILIELKYVHNNEASLLRWYEDTDVPSTMTYIYSHAWDESPGNYPPDPELNPEVRIEAQGDGTGYDMAHKYDEGYTLLAKLYEIDGEGTKLFRAEDTAVFEEIKNFTVGESWHADQEAFTYGETSNEEVEHTSSSPDTDVIQGTFSFQRETKYAEYAIEINNEEVWSDVHSDEEDCSEVYNLSFQAGGIIPGVLEHSIDSYAIVPKVYKVDNAQGANRVLSVQGMDAYVYPDH